MTTMPNASAQPGASASSAAPAPALPTGLAPPTGSALLNASASSVALAPAASAAEQLTAFLGKLTDASKSEDAPIDAMVDVSLAMSISLASPLGHAVNNAVWTAARMQGATKSTLMAAAIDAGDRAIAAAQASQQPPLLPPSSSSSSVASKDERRREIRRRFTLGTFKGTPNALGAAADFLRRLRMLFHLYDDASSDELQALLFPAFTDAAGQWLDRHIRRFGAIQVVDFLDDFKLTFLPDEALRRVKDALVGTKQGRESGAAYVARFEIMAGGLDRDALDEFLSETLVRGLAKLYAVEVRKELRHGKMSYSQLCEFVRDLDCIFLADAPPAEPAVTPAVTPATPTPMEGVVFHQASTPPSSSRRPHSQQTAEERRTCFDCKGVGRHLPGCNSTYRFAKPRDRRAAQLHSVGIEDLLAALRGLGLAPAPANAQPGRGSDAGNSSADGAQH